MNKGKNNYKIIKKSIKKSKKKKTKQHNASKKVKSKKKNIFKKYKSHLQSGYVIAVQSLIYKKPNFDAEQIFYLNSGLKILMSKKIFSPSHRFGTFYKVFIKKPHKIVGYISELDVIPEYKRQSKNQLNRKYQLLEKQLDKHGQINLDSLGGNKKSPLQTKNEPIPSQVSLNSPSWSKRYIGVSVGGRYNPRFSINDTWLGLKLSGDAFFKPRLKMDININFVPATLFIPNIAALYHADILLGIPLVSVYEETMVYIMAGLKMDVSQKPIPSLNGLMNYGKIGPIGSLSFVKLFTNKSLRMDLRVEYTMLEKKTHYSLLAAFQFGL